jgi:cytochrome c
MAIQYINGATADSPIIKAIEAELDWLDERIEVIKDIEDRLILMYKHQALMKVYRQFTTPFETMVIG